MKESRREIQRRIAYEVARILTEYRSSDQNFAVQKAMGRLGINDRRLIPTRQEIALALQEQQRLFRGCDQQEALNELRISALQVMKRLKYFNPLLVGAVFEGTADTNSSICLHLFASTPEEVIFTLANNHIPWQERDYSVKFHGSGVRRRTMPGFRLRIHGVTCDLIVFPLQGPYSKPINPQDNQPVQGANLEQFERLLDQR